MALPPPAADWMNRAAVDYIGPFVNAWAAFNAWYRHASGLAREREMLDFVKHRPNSARLHILPLLDDDNATTEARALKQAIYDLHQRLDAIHFEIKRQESNERISLRSVCINRKPLQRRRWEVRGHEYSAERKRGGAIEITVTSLRTQRIRFRHVQERYDSREVFGLPHFRENLSKTQRETLQQFYSGCDPRPMRDLVRGPGPSLVIAGMTMRCSAEELLSGLVETIYAMRNALLHGEVEPDRDVLRCYEPAYRIVMQFLACIA